MKTGDAATHRGFESHPLRQIANSGAACGRLLFLWQDGIGSSAGWIYLWKGVFRLKIAFFDSGMGGLSVLHHARRVLPHEEFLFYADEAHVPYGTKTRAEVEAFVAEAFAFLVGQGVDAIVVACNTATSVAVPAMRARYDLPIIGMEPAAKKALALDGSRRVLVVATPITIAGAKLETLIERVDKEHLVDRLALPELVTFAERQEFDSPAVRAYLQRELVPYPLEAYSAIVLGCTHFNYFKAALREVVPPSVRFVDGNEGTVNELVRRLRERGELAQAGTSATTYYYSGRRVTAPQELARIERYLRQLDRVYAL